MNWLPRHTVLLGACAGLVGGLLEGLAYNLFQKLRWLAYDVMQISVGPEQLWISALLNLALGTTLGLLLAGTGLVVRWRFWPYVVAGTFSLFFFFPLTAFSGRLRTSGAALLALGLAVQGARWVVRRQERILPRLPRIALMLVVTTAVYAGAVVAWKFGAAQYQSWRGPAPRGGAPNVVLIVLDTVRADHLSAYGYPRETSPHLDRMAKDGILFERAYSASSWSLPGHASLMTGRWSFEHRATARGDWQPLTGDPPTLAQALTDSGYRTGGFVGNLIWAAPFTGLSHGFQRYDCVYQSTADMFRRTFYDRLFRKWLGGRLRLARGLPGVGEPVLVSRFLAWAEGDRTRPFFAFLNFMAAHSTPSPSPEFRDKFKGPIQVPGQPDPLQVWKMSEGAIREREENFGLYDGAIAYLDDQVARLWKGLEERGLAANTVLIITADHGEHWGEQSIQGHGNSLYDAVLRVPLIIYGPKLAHRGVRVTAPVSTRNIPATVMDMLSRKDSPFPGPPLNPQRMSADRPPLVIGEVEAANFPGIPQEWPVRKGWLKCLVEGPWKLILHQSGETELYDLVKDPGETTDKDETTEGRPRAVEMLGRLKKLAKPARPGGD